MRVVVTGGTGFVGAGIVRAHLAAGDDVRVLSRRDSSMLPRDKMLPRGVRLIRGDLAQNDIPEALVAQCDLLYHCAGELRDEARMRSVHVEGTRALLERAHGSVGRWVQLSSVGVYGPHRNGTITEDTPEAPHGCYETTKAESDRLVREAHAKGVVEAVILRPSIIFGPGMPNGSLFALVHAIARGWFFFVGPRGASANYVPVEDVVDAMRLCGMSPAAAGRVFNLSASVLMEEFVGAIASALGKAVPTRRLPRLPLRQAALVLGVIPRWPLTVSRVDALSGRAVYSSERIETTLGYRARQPLGDALRRTVEHWRRERAV